MPCPDVVLCDLDGTTTDSIPGMASLIADIGASEMRLALATAKPIESAVRVLTRAGLIEHFDFVSGSELDLLRQDTPSVIAHAISGLGAEPTSITAMMIGDRKEDVLGAHHHGFSSIGVLWGFSDDGELEAAGAGHVVTSTHEIRTLLNL